MVEIQDFVPHGAVEAEVLEEYRGRVPEDLVQIWEKYGYGTFGGGFIRVINPMEYTAEVGDCIGKTQGDGVSIPVMVTALGDLICWEPSVGRGALTALMYRRNDVAGLGRVSSFLTSVKYGMIIKDLKAEIFEAAHQAHGELPYSESFIFVPLLSLGGPEAVENLHKRDTKAAIQVAVEFQGVIGH